MEELYYPSLWDHLWKTLHCCVTPRDTLTCSVQEYIYLLYKLQYMGKFLILGNFNVQAIRVHRLYFVRQEYVYHIMFNSYMYKLPGYKYHSTDCTLRYTNFRSTGLYIILFTLRGTGSANFSICTKLLFGCEMSSTSYKSSPMSYVHLYKDTGTIPQFINS